MIITHLHIHSKSRRKLINSGCYSLRRKHQFEAPSQKNYGSRRQQGDAARICETKLLCYALLQHLSQFEILNSTQQQQVSHMKYTDTYMFSHKHKIINKQNLIESQGHILLTSQFIIQAQQELQGTSMASYII